MAKTNRIEGYIQQIDDLTVTIEKKEGSIILPIIKFVEQKVEVVKQ